jgi:hypothetical protein
MKTDRRKQKACQILGRVGRLTLNLWKDRLIYLTDHPFLLHSVLLVLAMQRGSQTPPSHSISAVYKSYDSHHRIVDTTEPRTPEA